MWGCLHTRRHTATTNVRAAMFLHEHHLEPKWLRTCCEMCWDPISRTPPRAAPLKGAARQVAHTPRTACANAYWITHRRVNPPASARANGEVRRTSRALYRYRRLAVGGARSAIQRSGPPQGAAQASKATLSTLAHSCAAPGHYLQFASGRA